MLPLILTVLSRDSNRGGSISPIKDVGGTSQARSIDSQLHIPNVQKPTDLVAGAFGQGMGTGSGGLTLGPVGGNFGGGCGSFGCAGGLGGCGGCGSGGCGGCGSGGCGGCGSGGFGSLGGCGSGLGGGCEGPGPGAGVGAGPAGGAAGGEGGCQGLLVWGSAFRSEEHGERERASLRMKFTSRARGSEG